jgi:hypothetical protein
MRKTSKILSSDGSANANQNGSTARRSITPAGLVTYLIRDFHAAACR